MLQYSLGEEEIVLIMVMVQFINDRAQVINYPAKLGNGGIPPKITYHEFFRRFDDTDVVITGVIF